MPSLKELNLTNDQVGDTLDFDNLPKTGAYPPPLPPGAYRFKLPAKMTSIWQAFDAKVGQRITAIFDQDAPLVVTQATNGHVGDPFTTRISNAERPRGKDKINVSDMDYLLKALGHKGKPKTNGEYAQALMSYAGKEFSAQVEWQWSCNPKKNIYVDDGQGGSVEVPDKPGCGARYYQGRDVQKAADGSYPERITCGNPECNASVRAFPQLGSIG